MLIRNIDEILNRITMYRLVLYGLVSVLIVGTFFGFNGTLGISGPGLLISSLILLPLCYTLNRLFAYVFRASPSSESSLITALILVCILPPADTSSRAFAIALAGVIAIASKYIFVWRKSHLFNPAAFGATAVGLAGLLPITWWIGSPSMLPVTLLFGVLILRKIKRLELFIVFALTTLVIMLFANSGSQEAHEVVKGAFLSWPLIFFGSIMLAEPSTMPSTRYYRNLYAILVGVIFASQLKLGPISTTPQVALIAGNLFAFAVSPRQKLRLKLKYKKQITPHVTEFLFAQGTSKLSFHPGQYIEWTIPHKSIDARGNRRTFTIASSPTENDLSFGIKFYDQPSTFKQALAKLLPGDSVVGGNIAGDFTLPTDRSKNLVFIAGGIGITPFRSMIKYLIDTKQVCKITLFYLVSNPEEVAYKELLEEASRDIGLRVIYVMPGGITAKLDETTLKKHVSSYENTMFYISGPNAMVGYYRSLLRTIGIKTKNIVTDYFTGY